MSKGATGEIYSVPEDPKERVRYQLRAGEITTPELNEMRTFTPEKNARFAADPEARARERQAATDSITRLEDKATSGTQEQQ